MIYWIAYCLIRFLSWICFPYVVVGYENIPRQGGCIFASNHLSNLDPFLIGLSARRKISYMAKSSLFKNKILNFFLRQVEAFPIKREGPDIGALREALRRLKSGKPLVIFPEGTRKESKGNSKSVHPGSAFLAARSGVSVIPVYIKGSDMVLPPGTKCFKRHPISLTFGKPVLFSKQDSYLHVAQEIMGRITFLSS